MKRILVATVLLSMLLFLFAPPVLAAPGIVVWLNPPENTGKIQRADDPDDMSEYTFNIQAGDTVPPGFKPNLHQCVTFTPGPGQTASDVREVEPGEPGCCDEDEELVGGECV